MGGARAAAAAVVIALVALAVRSVPLTTRDLYNDEALQTTITRSFLEDGSLNNFRYSRFTPDSQYRRGVWVYYPPGFNLIQAPFLAADPTSHTAARLPVLVLNLLALLYLPILARRIWGTATPGWIASLLGALGVFHVGMSVTSLPYTLVAPLLVGAFLALVHAMESGRGRDWALVAILIAIGFHITQIALAFCALLAVVVMWGVRYRAPALTRAASICIGAAGALCAPWLIWTFGMGSPVDTLLSRAQGYTFAGQAGLVLQQYDLMLPSAIWKLAFLAGLITISRRLRGRGGLPGLLLALWALAPLFYLLSRNMWIAPRHVFAAYVPIVLVTGLGVEAAARKLVDLVAPRESGRSGVLARGVAIACVVVIAGAQLLAVRGAAASTRFDDPLVALLHGDAALEFGDPDIVSRASLFIRTHGAEQPVIAPVGFSEAHYVGGFVQDKRTDAARSRAWALARSGPAWVFMGDNFFGRGALDDFDRAVQQHGRLIVHSAPIPGVTAPDNPLGYALYHLDRPLPPAD